MVHKILQGWPFAHKNISVCSVPGITKLKCISSEFKTYQNPYRSDFKNKFLSYETDRLLPYFFIKSGQGGLFVNNLCSLSSNINFLVRNKHFLFHGS